MNPKPPSRIGKTTRRKDIYGNPMVYCVLDEIVYIPPSNPDKAIYLQKLRFEGDNGIVFRLCYYMIGQKGRGKGKWLYGQFATIFGKKNLKQFCQKHEKKVGSRERVQFLIDK